MKKPEIYKANMATHAIKTWLLDRKMDFLGENFFKQWVSHGSR